MKISIKQEHINLGSRCEPHSCPIALAIAEMKPKAQRVTVGSTLCSYHIGNKFYFYNMPEKAYDFVVAFDKGLPVEPFTFTVKLEKQ